MSHVYDQAYFERYEATFAGNEGIHFGIAGAIKATFPDAVSVLDVGCGRGYITQHLAILYPEVRGVDVSEWAVENRFPALDIRCMDVRSLSSYPYPPYEDWDLTVSWQLLEHLAEADDAQRAINSMAASCRFAMIHSIRVAESGAGEDATHTLMRPRVWWLCEFKRAGWFVDPAWQRRLEEVGRWEGSKELFVLRRA